MKEVTWMNLIKTIRVGTIIEVINFSEVEKIFLIKSRSMGIY